MNFVLHTRRMSASQSMFGSGGLPSSWNKIRSQYFGFTERKSSKTRPTFPAGSCQANSAAD